MLIAVIFLAVLPHFHGYNIKHACIPNTQFSLNGKVCFCDQQGWWDDSFCLAVRRRTCLPGHVIWQGCSQCICQESGHLTCNDAGCYDDATYRSGLIISSTPITLKSQDSKISRCTPFKSYYINCSICVCPASGKTSEAHCAKDNSCQKFPPTTSDFLMSINKNICIPRVMYLFPCLHCLCSDGGYFLLEKCVETCHRTQLIDSSRRCISRTFYRKNCNVCWCPDNSTPDDTVCTKSPCNKNSKFQSLESLRNTEIKCLPNKFENPKCIYCTCNINGNINENACLELDCLKNDNFKYDVIKNTCSPGEMIPLCLECFCLGNGMTNQSYCTKICSYQGKLTVLENVLKDSSTTHVLIAKDKLKRTLDSENCEPNTMYLDQGRYCLCPDTGSTNFKLCTSYTEEKYSSKTNSSLVINSNKKELNMTCTPNSFVEIDCNTCYCTKNGTVDYKWCTFDDCNAKRIIQSNQKTMLLPQLRNINPNATCTPGSITKIGCNYCICPDSGLLKEKTCTKNKCSEIQEVQDHNFVCEPLAYYLVDCNVCLCPSDGLKNVAKCTKKICEKTILRSDSCVPGQFFCSDCNVCVCPQNGDKADKVCTKHRCSETETTWKKIFKISQNLLSNQLVHHENKMRNLDLCFSGEEFELGCKICVCTDVGLRSYATCTNANCEENKPVNNSLDASNEDMDENDDQSVVPLVRSRRDKYCITLNLTDSSERIQCTPGSMYIIRCKQCICPYFGNINIFCRALPKGQYCEQAYPNFNFEPMGRRIDNISKTNHTYSSMSFNEHEHTNYTCTKPGKILDNCFICECEDDYNLIEEHCFKSNATVCRNTERPTFLDPFNKFVLG